MGRLSESSVVSIKNKSHAVTAEIEVPDGGAQGVIIAQGGSIGGWSLYLKDGRPRYCYNLFGIQRFYVEPTREVPAGHAPGPRWSSTTPGPGWARAATSRSTSTAQGRRGTVGATAAMIFSADDTCDVGRENGALVADDYPVPNAFTGEVNWVEIDVGAAAEDADHRIDPEEPSGWRWRGSSGLCGRPSTDAAMQQPIESKSTSRADGTWPTDHRLHTFDWKPWSKPNQGAPTRKPQPQEVGMPPGGRRRTRRRAVAGGAMIAHHHAEKQAEQETQYEQPVDAPPSEAPPPPAEPSMDQKIHRDRGALEAAGHRCSHRGRVRPAKAADPRQLAEPI